MPVHLEPVAFAGTIPIVWALRAGPQMYQFGDPYQVSAIVRKVSPHKVEVIALSGQLYPAFLSEVKAQAKEMGLSRVIWERRKGRGFETITMIINSIEEQEA